jgi:orotate phosphoribosyltransferase
MECEKKGMLTMKQELTRILCKKSFKFSEEPTFKLVSGEMSRFYINCKPTVLSPRGMYLAGHLIFDEIEDKAPDAVGGMTFGADPISVATAFVSEIKGKPFKAFSIRKEQKGHGIIKWVEGDLNTDDRVVILEDVVTTGGSTIKAIDRARSEGLNVVKVVTLVDRQEGGVENIKNHVPDVSSIITRDNLMDMLSDID